MKSATQIDQIAVDDLVPDDQVARYRQLAQLSPYSPEVTPEPPMQDVALTPKNSNANDASKLILKNPKASKPSKSGLFVAKSKPESKKLSPSIRYITRQAY